MHDAAGYKSFNPFISLYHRSIATEDKNSSDKTLAKLSTTDTC